MNAGSRSPARLVEHIERICREPLDERPLRIALIEELRRFVGFDWYAWLLTDPETEVGSSPLADTPSLADLPRLIRAKYLTGLNRWTSLDAGVATLHAVTGGVLERSQLWDDVLSGYGVVDVASLVFRDAHNCWGWLDLWRTTLAEPFGDSDTASLAGLVAPVTAALQGVQARTFDVPAPPGIPPGPAVLILSPDLRVTAQTPETEEYLRALVPPDGDRRPIPAGAYNVGAQLLAAEQGVDSHPPLTHVHLGGGAWVTLRAARVERSGPPGDRDIAVTIEASSPAERRSLFGRSYALSPRERELVDLLAQGADTRAVARQMFVSEHTVQDHLKSIFAKTGTRNRRTLVSRIAGG